MGKFKSTGSLSVKRQYELFGEIGQMIIEQAKADALSDETRMLFTMSCEGILEALSAGLKRIIGITCPECGKYKPVPPHPVDVDPSTHNVILTTGGTTLRCDCGHRLGEWDEDAEKWVDLPERVRVECPMCRNKALVPTDLEDGGSGKHEILLVGKPVRGRCYAKLICRCGQLIAVWDPDREEWEMFPFKRDAEKDVRTEALKLALINQTKMLVCIRDAFHARDTLIELIRVLQQNGTLNEEELGGQRHLLEMQMLPERTYRELIAREESVHAALETLKGESHE
jgi:DNA-directed RNA polymerase subunit RPC12/RpoP